MCGRVLVHVWSAQCHYEHSRDLLSRGPVTARLLTVRSRLFIGAFILKTWPVTVQMWSKPPLTLSVSACRPVLTPQWLFFNPSRRLSPRAETCITVKGPNNRKFSPRCALLPDAGLKKRQSNIRRSSSSVSTNTHFPLSSSSASLFPDLFPLHTHTRSPSSLNAERRLRPRRYLFTWSDSYLLTDRSVDPALLEVLTQQ